LDTPSCSTCFTQDWFQNEIMYGYSMQFAKLSRNLIIMAQNKSWHYALHSITPMQFTDLKFLLRDTVSMLFV